ncbi:hypothetical protein KKC67_02890 [Patescibacteria group bacterium]|nr:hypothetical protein [Patescibacteria group bacterium]MBU0879757.1 hypothetical protein [Patescibacteria group bacterium]MBU0880182.1 hypothetical protein [Patescibacteria group bacterium]MBU0897765.1 hypothetical protein [Patescibacteria group bacterium]MBU1062838.1 hypothetical protein [Patescibacteria group bacterium]
MQKQDLQQISDLLDQKLDQKFKDNNEILRKEFKDDIRVLKGEVVDEIGIIFKQTFDDLEVKIGSLEKKLDLAIDKDDRIVKKHNDFEIEMTANQGAHNRFEERILLKLIKE